MIILGARKKGRASREHQQPERARSPPPQSPPPDPFWKRMLPTLKVVLEVLAALVGLVVVGAFLALFGPSGK